MNKHKCTCFFTSLALCFLWINVCSSQVCLVPDQVANTILTNAGQSGPVNITLPKIEEGMCFTIFITDPTVGQLGVDTTDPMIWIEGAGQVYPINNFGLLKDDPHALGSRVFCVALRSAIGVQWFCYKISGFWSFGG